MILAATLGHSLERVALLADALLAALALCGPPRLRRGALAAALLATPVILAAALWRSTQLVRLRHHHALLAAGIIAALALALGLALLFRRRPRLLALAAVLALPFRFTVVSGETGGVLLLLYAVIAGGALAYALWGERALAPAAGPAPQPPPAPALERALAAFVVLYALQALYTPALSRAAEELCFFYVPFALLFVLLRRIRWDRRLLRQAAAAVLGLAVLFVAVAAVEYAAHRLLFQPSLNANESYFRVNSLFYDPNIYGRFLAIAMVLAATALVWERSRRGVIAAAALLALLWLGLLGSVSQSSLVALLAGLAVVAAVRFPLRWSAAGAVAVVIVAVLVAVAAAGRLHLNLSDTSAANNATGGRASLVTKGVDIFAARPFQGFGSGSFSCEYLRRTVDPAYACGAPTAPGITSDSHTEPITIAAEQGIIGLAVYLALLGAAVATFARGGEGLRREPVRVALLAAFVALVVHTWAYADFLEDPIAWALLALGASVAAAASPQPPPAAPAPPLAAAAQLAPD